MVAKRAPGHIVTVKNKQTINDLRCDLKIPL